MSDDVSYNNVLGKYKLMKCRVVSLLFSLLLYSLYSQGIVDSEFLADHLPWYRVRH